MQVATKAGLLSALVFPGVGQFYLKRWWRGLAFLAPSLFAISELGARLSDEVDLATDALMSGKVGLDPTLAAAWVDAHLPAPTLALQIATPLMLICWAASIVDAVLLARRQQAQQKATPAP